MICDKCVLCDRLKPRGDAKVKKANTVHRGLARILGSVWLIVSHINNGYN